MFDIITTYFDDIKIGVEVILALVIIVGFIQTRMLVSRMGVLKKLFNDFKAMEGELDLAVQKALNSFESIQQKMITGEKRMNTLVETAKNIHDDIDAQKTDIENVEASLSEILKQASVMEKALIEQFRNAKDILKKLDATNQHNKQTASYLEVSNSELPSASREILEESKNAPLSKERFAEGEESDEEGEASLDQTSVPTQEVQRPFPVRGTQNPLMQNRPYARR